MLLDEVVWVDWERGMVVVRRMGERDGRNAWMDGWILV